jgi:hypothetical protein
VADRAQRRAANLADALGDVVGGRENLLTLLVEEEMVIAEVGPDTCQWKFLVFR